MCADGLGVVSEKEEGEVGRRRRECTNISSKTPRNWAGGKGQVSGSDEEENP